MIKENSLFKEGEDIIIIDSLSNVLGYDKIKTVEFDNLNGDCYYTLEREPFLHKQNRIRKR